MKKKYKAYTQTNYNAEKLYVENESHLDKIITADNKNIALIRFIDYIHETSLYSREEKFEMLIENPIYIEEVTI